MYYQDIDSTLMMAAILSTVVNSSSFL